MATENIETRTAETILEKPVTVQVGEKTYQVAPPSIATIILVSEAVSRLPQFTLDTDKVVQECLRIGKECRILGEIMAILILGAQRSEKRHRTPHGGFFRRVYDFFHRRKEKDVLTEEILMSHSPKQMFGTFSLILGKMQLSDFFGVTTFLTEVNLLHQTKVEN